MVMGAHLLFKVQTVPSHNQYCLLSNMPSTWLPHPLQWEEYTHPVFAHEHLRLHVKMEIYFQCTIQTLAVTVILCSKRRHYYEENTF